jgi:Zn-dependent M28 family amino/carboxypeptidase
MPIAALLALVSLLQAPAPAAPAGSLVEDAARIAAAATNEARFDALTALLRSRGLTFAVEPFTLDKAIGREPRTDGRNVVVTLGSGTEDLVIGAHYDATRLPDGSLSRGAVDNAASSVMLVRLAESLRKETLALRVRIVWFDMEELGLVGSAHYVKQHAADRIAAMLNFDINAFGNTIVYGPSELRENAALRRTFVETCAAEEVACVGFPQMPPGDDRPFVKAGIPTISLGIIPAVEAHQLWLMMNAGPNAGLAPGTTPAILRTIHTPGDTVEKLSEETMGRMHRFALALVRSVVRRPRA